MAFVIPTIFTSVDRVSSTVKNMSSVTAAYNRVLGGTNMLSARQNTIISASNNTFRKLTPALSEATQQAMGFVKATAMVGGAMALFGYSGRQIMAYEENLASFRVIVSDLSNSEFGKFKNEIASVASTTRKSVVDVAAAFENIAGLNEAFAKTPEGLGAVAKAAITMGKAAGMQLAPAAESLVGIMNQFNMEAHEASKVSNVLAAGQAVGASSIAQSAEAYKNFGAVAKSANITLEQSQGLVQTLGSKMIMGAEAGTALRGSILRMQQAGVGYTSGMFQIDDALSEVRNNMSKMTSAKARDAYMTKVFGANNITAGAILINNIDTYKKFTSGVTDTNAAMEAAAIKSNTLGNRWEELKAKWTNIITTSDNSNASLERLKGALVWLTDNLPTIVLWTGRIVGLFVAWKAITLVTTGVMFGYNVALGLYIALAGKSALYTAGNTTAYAVYRTALVAGALATKAATAAQWLLNAALTANPIGVVVMAIAGMIAYISAVITYWDEWGKYVNLILGPFTMVIELIQSFRRNWDMITKAFKEGGILAGIKAIGVTILDAILSPLQRVLELAGRLPGKMGAWARSGASSIESFRRGMGVTNTVETKGATFTKFQHHNYQADGSMPWERGVTKEPLVPAREKAMAQMVHGGNFKPQDSKATVELVLKGNTDAVDVSKNKSNIPITLTPSMHVW